MAASSTRGDARDGRRYAYYHCRSAYVGACPNRMHVRIDRLWKAVTARLRDRLFPPSGGAGLPDWFPALVAEVGRELEATVRDDAGLEASLRRELEAHRRQLDGWVKSLGDPELSQALREGIQRAWGLAEARAAEVRAQLEVLARRRERAAELLDPAEVAGRLRRLDDLLGRPDDATAVGAELARHIERIEVAADGHILMRTTPFGLCGDLAELLRGPGHGGATSGPAPRRNGSPESSVDPPETARAEGDVGPGPGSVEGRSGRPSRVEALLTWEDTWMVEGEVAWSRRRYREVAALSRETGWGAPRLAAHYGVTIAQAAWALRLARRDESEQTGDSGDREVSRGVT